jgi:hypothetical protein
MRTSNFNGMREEEKEKGRGRRTSGQEVERMSSSCITKPLLLKSILKFGK